MLQMNKSEVWKFLRGIHRQQALQDFTVAQQKGGMQVVKESENNGRIKRIVCAAHENQPLEYFRAMSFGETVSIFCLLSV